MSFRNLADLLVVPLCCIVTDLVATPAMILQSYCIFRTYTKYEAPYVSLLMKFIDV